MSSKLKRKVIVGNRKEGDEQPRRPSVFERLGPNAVYVATQSSDVNSMEGDEHPHRPSIFERLGPKAVNVAVQSSDVSSKEGDEQPHRPSIFERLGPNPINVAAQSSDRHNRSDLNENCRNWLQKGTCKFGNTCRYKHDPFPTSSSRRAPKIENDMDEKDLNHRGRTKRDEPNGSRTGSLSPKRIGKRSNSRSMKGEHESEKKSTVVETRPRSPAAPTTEPTESKKKVDGNCEDYSDGCIMNVDYDAAEYLVDVIAANSDFQITYDDLKMQVQQSNQAITAFFDIETKYNFIFNKFPEIFIFKDNIISFTDTYLSMYRLEKPSKSFSYYGLAPDMKNSAILYFLKILSLRGPQQYLSLFRMLMNDRTQACASYFRNYADLDVFNFFASNPEYFILNNDIVRAKASILDVLYSKDNQSKAKLNEFVSFLLKCFGSFHYFELSKCIFYGENCCNKFLSQFSLIKQREHFENLPDTVMDKYGFLSLHNKDAHISLSQRQKTKLLIVCILAFKKKIHFSDLINGVIEKSNFSLLSNEDQLKFFLKKFPSYFIVSKDGFVKLLPTFFLPKCSFVDLTSEAFKQVTSELNNIKLNGSLISYQNDITSNEEPKKKKVKVENNISSVCSELNKNQKNSPNETLISYQDDVTSDEESKKKKIKIEMGISSVHPELNKIKDNSPNETSIGYQSDNLSDEDPQRRNITGENALNKHACFVLECFESMHYFELRECICFADPPVKKFLNKFSETEQQEYFEKIPNTVIDKNGFLSLKNKGMKTKIPKSLKIKLMTVCILAFKKKMHFKDLVNEAVAKSNMLCHKRCNFLKSTEALLNFFVKYPSIFVVSEDGFVQLLPTFLLGKYSFEELSSAFQKTKQNACTKEQNNTLINSCVHSLPIESSLPSNNFTVKSETNMDEACLKVPSHLPQHSLDFRKKSTDTSTTTQNSISCKKSNSTSWFNALCF